MKIPLRRVAVASATALALLVLLAAAPAGAAPYAATIGGGTVTLTKTPNTSTIPLSSTGGGTGCVSGSLTVDLTATTADVTAASTVGRFTLGSSDFVAVINRTGSTPGTVSGTNISNAIVSLSAVVYRTVGTGCTLGTRVCGFNATLSFTGVYNGPTGTPGSPAAGDTATLSAPNASLSTVPPCGVPFATYIGGTVRVDNLIVQL